MSTTPIPVPGTSTVSTWLAVLTASLNALAVIPGIGADAAIAGAFISIITAAVTSIRSQTGLPIDLTKIPIEPQLP